MGSALPLTCRPTPHGEQVFWIPRGELGTLVLSLDL
jgi:hypothetical protein